MSSLLQLPGKIRFGQGSLEQVAQTVEKNGIRQVLIFTDKHLRKLGMTEALEAYIAKAGASFEIVDTVAAEPTVQDIEKALAAVQNADTDLIIGVGGGSVLDCAKLASVLLGASCTIHDLLKDPLLAQKKYRTLMIPTTCGTGSEATCNSIVVIPEEQVKKGIVNPALIPDEVILDVTFIESLPAPIIAATGVDALAHCVECYTGKKATPLSDLYAAAGAKLIFHNIEKAYAQRDLPSLANMLLGAYYGGVAITGSGTTAVHALSYPLGGRYHIPHGVSNAILFSGVMRFNRDACKGRLSTLCDSVYPEYAGKTEDAKADILIERIAEIVKNTGIPVSLKEFDIKEGDLDDLVLAGSQQTRLLTNNMKELSLDDIRVIYRQLI